MISQDRRRGVFVLSQTAMSTSYPTDRVVLPGLQPDARYDVTVEGSDAFGAGLTALPWLEAGAVHATGRELGTIGVRPLVMLPQQSMVVTVRTVT